MNKSTAIQVLKDQREALKTAANIKEWRDTTNAFLEEAMNPDKQAFKDFKYYQENDIAGLTSRLNLCIDIVEKAGVHGASKVNWFCRLSEGWAIALVFSGLIPALGLFFWLGTWVPAATGKSQNVTPEHSDVQKAKTNEKGGPIDSAHVSNVLGP